jgi:hypothetical protein
MARITHARTEQRSAQLTTDFGLKYAIKLFGQEAIDSLPLLQSGPRRGKPKGHVIWRTTTSAGYHVNAGRGVAAGTVVRAWIGAGPFSGEEAALTGLWLGRTQQLCGSRDLLTAEYRAQHAAEQARDAAELQAQLAEMEG